MLTTEEYQALAEQINEKFFTDELSVLSNLNDLMQTTEFPHQAIKEIALTVIAEEYTDKLKELSKAHKVIEIDSEAWSEAQEWLYDALLDGMTQLYNKYLSPNDPVEWTEDTRMREEREDAEQIGDTWPQLMGHTPDVSEKLAQLANDLDKSGYFAQASAVDKVMKNMIK